MTTCKTIGIVGNGYVGNALYQNFKNIYDTKVYDIISEKSRNTLEEIFECQVIFICLPTPMKKAEGSECNLDIIFNFFRDDIPQNCKSLFVIKSTIPIGTTKQLAVLRKDLKIIHNPEFLTALNSIEDFKNSYRNIIGGNIQHAEPLLQIFNEIFPDAINIFVSSDESESIKYFANTFLSFKVTYFNLVYDLCQKLGCDYEKVINGICTDKRIGFSHSRVPGPDGDRGFGGTCFPKDINALIKSYDENNLDCNILKEVWKYNKKIRKNWDWSNNKSAVCKE